MQLLDRPQHQYQQQKKSPPLTLPPTIEISRDDVLEQAKLFKALDDPNRLRMLRLLLHKGGLICVHEMVKYFHLEQPTVSHHLRILREAHIVDSDKDSLYVYYYVRRETLLRAKAIIEEMLAIEVESQG